MLPARSAQLRTSANRMPNLLPVPVGGVQRDMTLGNNTCVERVASDGKDLLQALQANSKVKKGNETEQICRWTWISTCSFAEA